MAQRTKIIIDCDPGLDDAVALLAAFGATDLDIVAITTVAGNVRGAQTALNARIIREAGGRGREIPVCAGAPRPLFREPVTAEDFHGSTGLGGLAFAKPVLALSRVHAVTMIVRQCRAARRVPLTMVVTGPMTNLALALIMDPDCAKGIGQIVLMGGAASEGGNITPFAEFNVFADPHAAAIVFGSGLPIRCLSLDVTHTIRTTGARLAAIRGDDTPRSRLAADLLEASCKLEFSANGERDAPLHDPSTILALVQPELFEGLRASVRVVTDERSDAFGQTEVTFGDTGPVLWATQADVDGAYDLLRALLRETV